MNITRIPFFLIKGVGARFYAINFQSLKNSQMLSVCLKSRDPTSSPIELYMPARARNESTTQELYSLRRLGANFVDFQVVDNKRLLKLLSLELYSYCIDYVKFSDMGISISGDIIRDPNPGGEREGGYPLISML